jgi:hypothetical protein
MNPSQNIARRPICLPLKGISLLIGGVVFLLADGVAHAVAQNASDVFNIFNSMMRAAIVQNARSEWTKNNTCSNAALRYLP